jgi:hypothetical protein
MRLLALLAIVFLFACNVEVKTDGVSDLPIKGTWQLFSATLVENGDSTTTDYTKDKKFIKIINDSHFSFTSHDLAHGKDSATAAFSAGAGSYTLKDSTYTERLEFCSAREWEGHDFTFTVSIKNDTLVQSGIEKIEGTNVNRLNIEKYVRVK